MKLALIDFQNDCSFSVIIKDESKKDLTLKLMKHGLNIWYQAAHDESEIEPDSFFTKEDILAFYESGYTEPTSELLDYYGIEHEIVDVEYDENDEVVCDEYIVY